MISSLAKDHGARRAAALGLAAALVLAVLAGVSLLSASLRSMAGEAERELHLHRSLMAQKDRLETAVATLSRTDDAAADSRFVHGESAAQAAAALQTRVKELAARHGASVQRTRVMPAKPVQNYERVSIAVQLTIENEGLRDLLHEVETGRPKVFVDRLQIRPQVAFLRQADQQGAPRRPLNVGLELAAYWQPGGS